MHAHRHKYPKSINEIPADIFAADGADKRQNCADSIFSVFKCSE